jgi:hypothetical protein
LQLCVKASGGESKRALVRFSLSYHKAHTPSGYCGPCLYVGMDWHPWSRDERRFKMNSLYKGRTRTAVVVCVMAVALFCVWSVGGLGGKR